MKPRQRKRRHQARVEASRPRPKPDKPAEPTAAAAAFPPCPCGGEFRQERYYGQPVITADGDPKIVCTECGKDPYAALRDAEQTELDAAIHGTVFTEDGRRVDPRMVAPMATPEQVRAWQLEVLNFALCPTYVPLVDGSIEITAEAQARGMCRGCGHLVTRPERTGLITVPVTPRPAPCPLAITTRMARDRASRKSPAGGVPLDHAGRP